MRYYHVAGSKYQEGEPLICWRLLEEIGVVTPDDWKWDPEIYGWLDQDVVCLFDNLEEAEDFKRDFGGRILTVDIPDSLEEGEYYDLPWGGSIEPRMTKVREGYTGIEQGIPEDWITALD